MLDFGVHTAHNLKIDKKKKTGNSQPGSVKIITKKNYQLPYYHIYLVPDCF